MNSLATMRFTSKALQRRVTYHALLPQTGKGPFPVILQLHGYEDDESDWLYQTNLARYAAGYPFIIVMPNGANSFYLDLERSSDPHDSLGRQHYEKFLVEDLRTHVTTFLPAQEGRWGIGGQSMGGYGAVRLGCKYPELFASIYAHSGVYFTSDDLAGRIPAPEDADIHALTIRMARSEQKVSLNFDCGTDDELIVMNRRLHRFLEEQDIPHTYTEHEGEHNWHYWDIHIQDALAQHARVLLPSK